MVTVPQMDILIAEKLPDILPLPGIEPGDRAYSPYLNLYARMDSIHDYEFVMESGPENMWRLSPSGHSAKCPNFMLWMFCETFGLHTQVVNWGQVPKHCFICGERIEAGRRFIIPGFAFRSVLADSKDMISHSVCLGGNLHRIPVGWHPAYQGFDNLKPVLFRVKAGEKHRTRTFEIFFSESEGLKYRMAYPPVSCRVDEEIEPGERDRFDYRMLWDLARRARPEIPEFPFSYGGVE